MMPNEEGWPDMDTRWFQDFVTLAEVRNFTRAAECCNVTQPALTRAIQRLRMNSAARCCIANAA